MPLTRQFLNWNQPVLNSVIDYLFSGRPESLLDFGDTLVVVPTQQAGRRLREGMAIRAHATQQAVLSLQVTTPAHLLPRENGRIADSVTLLDMWADLLLRIELEEYRGLFPVDPVERNFTWAVRTGDLLQKLRSRVAEGGLMLRDVPAKAGEALYEEFRWEDLARLEAAFLARVKAADLLDPVAMELEAFKHAELPDNVKHLVVACVPDPVTSLLLVLDKYQADLDINILVHAPEELADGFDTWGRPIPEFWNCREIDIPAENLFLEASPREQSARILSILSEQSSGPADVAIGVADSDVTPTLMTELDVRGIRCFNPAGLPLLQHPVPQLLMKIRGFVERGTYRDVTELVHHPDILSLLADRDINISQTLSHLDELRAKHLPTDYNGVHVFASHPKVKETFEGMLGFLDEILKTLRENSLPAGLRQLLCTIYESRTLLYRSLEDREWDTVATQINGYLEQLQRAIERTPAMPVANQWQILCHLLKQGTFSPPRESAVVDLEGWLELTWNDAAKVLVSGMNEGSVPDGKVDDAFLPDSLRRALGLRRDETRLSRDAYLLSSLFASRGPENVFLICGKHNSTGDPLKPSRLLFRCPDALLVQRVRKLMAAPSLQLVQASPQIDFQFNLLRSDQLPPEKLTLKHASPSRLNSYLACPFRYYLKYVLGMSDKVETPDEMDAALFGELTHLVVQQLKTAPHLHTSTDPNELFAFFEEKLRDVAKSQFGRDVPFLVSLQLENLLSRLYIAAQRQADLAADGWRISNSEVSLSSFEVAPGVPFYGRIDRIDVNEATGEWLVIDYKTSDGGHLPDKNHFKSCKDFTGVPDYRKVTYGPKAKDGIWTDLQLPLYVLAVRHQLKTTAPVTAAYFNLPKKSENAGLQPLPLTDEQLKSAAACAAGAVNDIHRRKFWPPNDVTYDDFEELFPLSMTDAIDVAAYFTEEGVLK